MTTSDPRSASPRTALLDYAARAAADLRLVRVAGVESEMELAFAARRLLAEPVLLLIAAPGGHSPEEAAARPVAGTLVTR